ncbi:hypothetical protein NP493_5g09025 [Ridgeia piscesae]|uniref:Uncharacterized protein n=1 Tax=Ridgeia piscesae TaxID=27915 RepID=A0AAD9PFE4_RIDPI|nr:hypothetical protein NP493_5g09025 [Ridgeia piscesae]
MNEQPYCIPRCFRQGSVVDKSWHTTVRWTLDLGSDTSSIRSYGSNIGSYKNSPDTNRWRSPSYSAPRDSSLAFAALNRGYVSSVKDRFSATPSAGERRLSLSRSLSGGRDYRFVGYVHQSID